MPSFLQEQACLYSIGRLLPEDMSISSPIRIAAYGLRYIFDGGGFTLSGDGTSSILPALFHVESGVTLELRNIVPTNTGGHAVIVDGGAELVAGEGVWFRGNGDSAVYINATAKASFTSTNFTDNHAIKKGGGIRVKYGGTIEVTSAMFTNNTADRLGGGIFVGRNAKATIKSSTFNGNAADGKGGGIFFHGHTKGTIKSSTFNGNVASSEGGALWKEKYGGPLSGKDCDCSGNEPENYPHGHRVNIGASCTWN